MIKGGYLNRYNPGEEEIIEVKNDIPARVKGVEYVYKGRKIIPKKDRMARAKGDKIIKVHTSKGAKDEWVDDAYKDNKVFKSTVQDYVPVPGNFESWVNIMRVFWTNPKYKDMLKLIPNVKNAYQLTGEVASYLLFSDKLKTKKSQALYALLDKEGIIDDVLKTINVE